MEVSANATYASTMLYKVHSSMKVEIKQILLRPEALALVLALLTASVMAWQYLGMNKSIVITPKQGYSVRVEDDRLRQGDSVASLEESDTYRMRCQLNRRISFPECSLIVELQKDSSNGIDLSPYEELELTFDYTSSKHDTLRIQLKSLDQSLLNADNDIPQSIGEHIVTPIPETDSYTLRLADFYVPSEWVFASKLPPITISPNLKNISYLIISNGSNENDINFDLIVKRIEFKGKWISAEALYRTLLWLWIGSFFCYFMCHFLYLRHQSHQQQIITSELKNINDALESRRKRLETIAIHDKLTGIYNRAGMRDSLHQAIDDKRKKEMPFCTLLIEIDYLNAMSEKYGIEKSEQIICETVNLINRCITKSDILARWNNAEFLLLCPNTTLDKAASLASQLCNQIYSATKDNPHPISCSIGVAEIHNTTIDTLLDNTETALINAQKKGRNQFYVFEVQHDTNLTTNKNPH